jgi:hypothetical protein
MGAEFFRITGAPVFSRLAGSLNLDVAPPPGALVGLSAAAIAVLCCLVIVVVVVAFLVIRAVKKNRAG